jgi:large subunit ribosomal protein L14
MLFKESWLYLADNTNIRWLRLFHLYKGFKRRSSTIGFFIKGSARMVEPPRLEYKGFKIKFNKKGDICRALVLRIRKPTQRLDGSISFFNTNSGLSIRKLQTPKSKYVNGPTTYNLYRKQFKSLFRTIL